jgi:endonuclease/exonuclease/phosphatase family metal-dependent hydrolase
VRTLFSFLIYFFFWSALSGENLRIATYNLRNYLVMDRMVEGQWRPDYPKPEREKVAIREVILEASPDILVLQEIGPAPFLDELREDLLREGLEYSHSVHMQAADSVRHLAVLSKVAPSEVVKHVDLDFKYLEDREFVKRGLLELKFEGESGGSFQLFAVHLKSRFTDKNSDPQSEMRRTREAEACRNRIIERTLDAGRSDYLVAGDFNDHPASSTLRRFYTKGDLVLGDLVTAVDSRGEHWTYFYSKEKRYESIDGFVASPELSPRIRGAAATIVDTPGALLGSDHRLVYLDLEISGD